MIFSHSSKFCVVFALLCVAQVALAAKKPNVILIITDDQSWDTLGFAGGKVHTSAYR